MRRLHLLVVGNRPWCPVPLPDEATRSLQRALHGGHNREPVVPLLRRKAERVGLDGIVPGPRCGSPEELPETVDAPVRLTASDLCRQSET